MRPVMSVQLYRPNVHLEPRPVRDILEIIKGATALFLWVLIGAMVMV